MSFDAETPAEMPGADRSALPRASDTDRHAAVAALRAHCSEGRLTLDEFSDRVGSAFAAVHASDLDRVLADLPPLVRATSDVGSRGTGWIISVFGTASRRGFWRPRPTTTVVAFMGTCRLDLRQAVISGQEQVIRALIVMGSLEIVVPDGIDAQLSGLSIMGSKQIKVRPNPQLAGSPIVRVRAVSLMGNVLIKSKRSRNPV